MTQEVRERMNRCVEALKEVVLNLGPNWRVSPFGSAANGFGTKFSDLDATCYELPPTNNNEKEHEQQPAAEILSGKLAPLLREHPEFTMAQEVLHARVPILKLCFEGKLEVDLSCHNTAPLHNTKLLKAYSVLDDNVRDLVIAVKIWAKDLGVCGASRSHLSSYALTLMAIYFLQVHPKILMPMLPVQAFKEDSDDEIGAQKVQAARSSWRCTLNLGQLYLRFFQFYTEVFTWGSEVCSVRLAQRRDASEIHLQKLKGRHHQRLHVEDPVDETRNLNCVLGEMQELQLREAIQETYGSIRDVERGGRQSHLPHHRMMDAKEAAKEFAAKDLAGSPNRLELKVYDHLPGCPEEAVAFPSAVEAIRRRDPPEPMVNVRAHSLSEASTAASCSSSTDEAANDDEEPPVGANGAHEECEISSGAYLLRGKEKLHRRSTTEGQFEGPAAPEENRMNPLLQLFRNSETTMPTSGQAAGQQLLQMVKNQKHEKPVTEMSDCGYMTAQPSAQLLPRLLPQMTQPPPAPPAPPLSQQLAAAQTAQLPTSSPPESGTTLPRRPRKFDTKNILAKVQQQCEAHNKVSEWQ